VIHCCNHLQLLGLIYYGVSFLDILGMRMFLTAYVSELKFRISLVPVIQLILKERELYKVQLTQNYALLETDYSYKSHETCTVTGT